MQYKPGKCLRSYLPHSYIILKDTNSFFFLFFPPTLYDGLHNSLIQGYLETDKYVINEKMAVVQYNKENQFINIITRKD